MKTFMLDSMIYDKLDADSDVLHCLENLVRAGIVRVLITHVQMNELAAIRDEKYRAAVMKVLDQIPCEFVITAGILYGISSYGCSAYTDAKSSSVIDAVIHKSTSDQHGEDALIVSTAVRDADVFVTEEKKRRHRFKAALGQDCELWTFTDFRTYILTQRGSMTPL